MIRKRDRRGSCPRRGGRVGPLGLLIAGLAIAATYAATAFAAGGLQGPSDPAGVGEPRHFWLMVIYASIALVFSFLCSVAEAVVLSVSPSYIATLEKEGRRSAGSLKGIKANVDRSLAGILTLNTIAHTVGAGGAGAEAAAYFGDKYVGIAMAVLTLLILFLSEIIPKTLGAVYWRSLAPLTARFVLGLCWLLHPLLVVSEKITRIFTGGRQLHVFSREEFTALADLGVEGGQLDAKESRILNNLLRLPDLRAKDVMTPRTVVVALQQDRTVREILEKHPEISFTRLPIYGENHDDVTGFVLRTDILLNEYQRDGRAKLRDLKREIRAVPETARLSQVFEDLLDNRAHVLLVIDEYGGMAGLVTLEDVVETLIGIEIVDEADKVDDMRRLARKKWEERMDALGIDVRKGEEPTGGPQEG